MFHRGEFGCEEVSPRNHNHIKTRVSSVLPKDLAHHSFGAISLNGSPQLPGRRNTEPRNLQTVREGEERHEATVDLRSTVVDKLELSARPEPVTGWERLPHRISLLAYQPSVTAIHLGGQIARKRLELLILPYYSTVSRLRPLARRRFSTKRPFLVDMRTKNPCVRRRRRRFGWNVRFMSRPLRASPKSEPLMLAIASFDCQRHCAVDVELVLPHVFALPR